MWGYPRLWAGVGLYQNFRGFDILGVPYVYINREIKGMPVILLDWNYCFQILWIWKLRFYYPYSSNTDEEFKHTLDYVFFRKPKLGDNLNIKVIDYR